MRKHFRVHHPGTEDLDPAALLAYPAACAKAENAADVDLGPGLDKREEAGTEAHPYIRMEKLLQKGLQSAFQVPHSDALVHHEHVHLVEHGRVRGIERVPPVDLARVCRANRGFQRLHGVHLDRRAVRPQERQVVEIERVLRVARRVIAGHVQGFEIVVVLLDLREVEDPESHADEDLLDILLQLLDRVFPPEGIREARPRHIDTSSGRELFGFQGNGPLCLQPFLRDCPKFVHRLAECRTLLLRKLAQPLHPGRDDAVFPRQPFVANDFPHLEAGDPREVLLEFPAHFRDWLAHRLSTGIGLSVAGHPGRLRAPAIKKNARRCGTPGASETRWVVSSQAAASAAFAVSASWVKVSGSWKRSPRGLCGPAERLPF